MTSWKPVSIIALIALAWIAAWTPSASAAQIAATTGAADPLPHYIGTATMEPDGTLVLWLRAESGAIVGHGTMRVAPGDPQYEDYKRHIGGIVPGETKPVPPWPDESDKPDDSSRDPSQDIVPPEP